MSVDRRKFLKLSGLSALALTGGKPAGLFAPAERRQNHSSGETQNGKRWAMVVDLRKCVREKGCTKCIDACHDVHNVPKFDNTKDEIKWIWKENYENAFEAEGDEFVKEGLREMPVPLLCNHCDNPPCVRVCPTKATWKREDGIVMMDWHRCIGCRYCMAACPYGSRSFNWRDPRPFIKNIHEEFPTRMRGVVEKCTFCDERLARGQLPACVEACNAKALVFGDLEDPESEVRRLLHDNFSIRRKPALGTNPEVYYIV
ncbi:MAG TPA: 4Fe-4S dicluster domain-containing protein [Bacteroidetes bacterium]|nr:4Fe-4S dicluster domain-containing protein [Bacteroidota bacterium]